MRSRLFASLGVAGVVLSLIACAGGPSYPKEVAEGYFSAIASLKPEKILAAAELSVPGSDAEAYAIEQAAHTQALLDGGTLDDADQTVVLEANEVLLCVDGYDSPDVEKSDYCSIYSNLQFDGDKLVTFDAGGEPLEGRIALGSGEVVPIGSIGDAKHLASYITIAGDLVVIVEVTSKTSELMVPYDALYLAPNGRQVEVSMVDGVNSLSDGRFGNVAYSFSSAEFGGELELKFYDSNFDEVTILIPTS